MTPIDEQEPERWQPVPVPQGDARHDIGDDTRTAIVRRLISDWDRDPDLTPEKVRQLAMWAAASVRSLLHELGTLRDMDTHAAQVGDHYVPERDGRRCVEHPRADHELVCLTCLETRMEPSETLPQEEAPPPAPLPVLPSQDLVVRLQQEANEWEPIVDDSRDCFYALVSLLRESAAALAALLHAHEQLKAENTMLKQQVYETDLTLTDRAALLALVERWEEEADKPRSITAGWAIRKCAAELRAEMEKPR